jgi:hypothetical protein
VPSFSGVIRRPYSLSSTPSDACPPRSNSPRCHCGTRIGSCRLPLPAGAEPALAADSDVLSKHTTVRAKVSRDFTILARLHRRIKSLQQAISTTRVSRSPLVFFNLDFRCGEIDRTFELVSAHLARPHVLNTAVESMLRTLWCNDSSTALRTLSDHGNPQLCPTPPVAATSGAALKVPFVLKLTLERAFRNLTNIFVLLQSPT